MFKNVKKFVKIKVKKKRKSGKYLPLRNCVVSSGKY